MRKYRCAGATRRPPVCDYESELRWLGACPGCGRWYNIIAATPREMESKKSFATLAQSKPPERISTGIPEFDKVLGGGLGGEGYGVVPGSTLVIGGKRGSGKSTLLLQAADGIQKACGGNVVYSSGEQSTEDIGYYAARLKVMSDKVTVLGNEADILKIVDEAVELKAKLLVVDSLQTAIMEDAGGDVGTVTQVNAAINYLYTFGKTEKCAVLAVSHLNKVGEFASSEAMGHLCDALLFISEYIEFDEGGNMIEGLEQVRMIESAGKNRFGDTSVKGYLEMTGEGLQPLSRNTLAILKKKHLTLI